MFEYTALVDAPVKRFTSIVTDPEPEETPVVAAVVAAVVTTAPPIAVPVLEAPLRIVAIEAEPHEPHEPIGHEVATPTPVDRPSTIDRPTTIEHPTTIDRPVPVGRRFVPRAQPAPSPSIVPALIGVAAAGITAFLWMRRDAHGVLRDRGR